MRGTYIRTYVLTYVQTYGRTKYPLYSTEHRPSRAAAQKGNQLPTAISWLNIIRLSKKYYRFGIAIESEPFGAGSEIRTIVSYDHETHFVVNTKMFGRSVWRELSFYVNPFETEFSG